MIKLIFLNYDVLLYNEQLNFTMTPKAKVKVNSNLKQRILLTAKNDNKIHGILRFNSNYICINHCSCILAKNYLFIFFLIHLINLSIFFL